MSRKITLLTSLVVVLLSVNSHAAQSVKNLFKKVNPAVVVINTQSLAPINAAPGQVSERSLGSGVIISADGKILTAAHVVHSVDKIRVEILGFEPLTATVLASSVAADVALIQLDHVPEGLKVAKMGDSESVETGDRVMVIGAPYGLEHTLTVGFISSRRSPDENNNAVTEVEYFQTDAAINSGNSGGPMFDDNGKVIGIVSHIKSRTGGSEGLGFATTINVAKNILFTQNHFWGGAETVIVQGDLARALNIPGGYGMLVQRVAQRSPGFYLGLQGGNINALIAGTKLLIGGDIIIEAEGLAFSADQAQNLQILKLINAKAVGDRIDAVVLRAGKRVPVFTTR